LLNAQNAEYLVVGAWAMILNSVVRATSMWNSFAASHKEL
jgi:hypothetical protein